MGVNGLLTFSLGVPRERSGFATPREMSPPSIMREQAEPDPGTNVDGEGRLTGPQLQRPDPYISVPMFRIRTCNCLTGALQQKTKLNS